MDDVIVWPLKNCCREFTRHVNFVNFQRPASIIYHISCTTYSNSARLRCDTPVPPYRPIISIWLC